MVKTKYVMARVTMTGLPPIYCDGLKVTDDQAVEDEFYGGSADRLSQTWKKRTVKVELINPRDHMALNQFIYACRRGASATVTGFAEDENGNMKALERVDGFTVPGRERSIGNFDAVKLVIKGSADNTEPLAATYD